MHPIIGWVIGILAIVILGTVADLLLANTRMGKYVKSIFAAVTILVIILPLPSMFASGCNFDDSFIIQPEFELDQSFIDFSNRIRINSLNRGIEAQLRADGASGTVVEVDGIVVNNEIIVQSVTVNIQNATFDTIVGQLNPRDFIVRRVAEHLHIDRAQVIVI